MGAQLAKRLARSRYWFRQADASFRIGNLTDGTANSKSRSSDIAILTDRIMRATVAASHVMFDNLEITPDELPEADSVDWQSMDSRFLRRLLTQTAIAFVIIVIGVSSLQAIFNVAFAEEGIEMSFGWLWLVIPLVAVLWPAISVPRMAYAIRDKDILYKSGVFWQTVTAVPFNRIQHVEKSSTPLDRRFEIATLQLFTAGGSGGDLKIHGLSAQTAESLRIFIIEKVGSSIERH
jgi:membrane protein YdbS with pleckstrin-like domain